MSDVPDNWERRSLASLALYLNGFAFKPRHWGEEGLPIIRIRELLDESVEPDRYSGQEASAFRIDDGDLIFSWSATLAALIWQRGPGLLNQHLFKVLPAQDVDVDFLCHLLDYNLDALTARSHGTTMKHITRGDLAHFAVPLPHLSEQQGIAAVLNALDDQIGSVDQTIQKLNVIQTGLMRDLLQTDNRSTHRWPVLPLAKVVGAPITYGIVQAGPHVPGGVPYIRTGDMNGDELQIEGMLRTSRRIAASYARSAVRTGELVCAIRATVGKVLPVPSELDGANLTQGTARIAPGKRVDPRYLYWETRSERVQEQIALAIKGTTFLEITLAALRQIRVAVPPLAVQREVAEVLDAHEVLARRERILLAKLQSFRAGLSADLLTGRVRVPAEVPA
jgi:type I restriction enzyme S subunit